jgi:hypothetical protein
MFRLLLVDIAHVRWATEWVDAIDADARYTEHISKAH